MIRLRCNICGWECNSGEPHEYNRNEKYKVNSTHVCDRFQYGFMKAIKEEKVVKSAQ